MLDRRITIEQFCAHCSNIREQGKLHHAVQPLRVNNLSIIIEEHHHLAPRRLNRQIIQP